MRVVYLKVSDEWAIERLLGRGREDDTEENIKERLSWFYNNTFPAIEYLKNQSGHDYYEINGEQTVEEVHNDIIKCLFQ